MSTASYSINSKNMAVKVMKLEIYFPSDYIRHPGGGCFFPSLSIVVGEKKTHFNFALHDEEMGNGNPIQTY